MQNMPTMYLIEDFLEEKSTGQNLEDGRPEDTPEEALSGAEPDYYAAGDLEYPRLRLQPLPLISGGFKGDVGRVV
jgi:hypothetical protein